MTDKELRKLNRAELIDIIYYVQSAMEELQEENQVIKGELKAMKETAKAGVEPKEKAKGVVEIKEKAKHVVEPKEKAKDIGEKKETPKDIAQMEQKVSIPGLSTILSLLGFFAAGYILSHKKK